jgi:thymidylate synthase (FAD)
MSARVILVAATVLYRERLTETRYMEHAFPSDAETVLSADELAEIAGRVRDNDWDRLDKATSTNWGYLAQLQMNGQPAEFEHASATFYIDGISIGVARKIQAHRQLAVSLMRPAQVAPNDHRFVTPASLVGGEADDLEQLFETALDLYDEYANELERQGYTLETARSVAECVLPQCTEATLLVTGSMAAWRTAIEDCGADSHDEETRDVAGLLLAQLAIVAPNTFQDMPRRWIALTNPDGGSTAVVPMFGDSLDDDVYGVGRSSGVEHAA